MRLSETSISSCQALLPLVASSASRQSATTRQSANRSGPRLTNAQKVLGGLGVLANQSLIASGRALAEGSTMTAPSGNTTDDATTSGAWDGGWANGRLRPTAVAPRGTNSDDEDDLMKTILSIALPLLAFVVAMVFTIAICAKKGKCARQVDGETAVATSTRSTSVRTSATNVVNPTGVSDNSAPSGQVAQTARRSSASH